jgi:hypothetical protein
MPRTSRSITKQRVDDEESFRALAKAAHAEGKGLLTFFSERKSPTAEDEPACSPKKRKRNAPTAQRHYGV